jgi:hypothetical protein
MESFKDLSMVSSPKKFLRYILHSITYQPKKKPQSAYFCPRYRDEELDEDSTCIWISIPFATTKKIWYKLFATFFLRRILNLNTYTWRKWCLNPVIITPIWGFKNWSKKCSRLHLCLHPSLNSLSAFASLKNNW